MDRPQHPGKITFVDGNTQAIRREADAAELPESIAFVAVEGQLHPVVRIVDFTSDDQRIIRQYGIDGQLLFSTLQLRDPEAQA